MSEAKLWHELQAAELVSGEAPDKSHDEDETLWYVRVLQGFAGWLAALFLMAFLGFGVAGLFDNGAAMMTMGVIVNFSAYVFFKSNPDSDFFEQMVLAFSLTGQFLFAFGLFELTNFREPQIFVLVGLYQIALALLINHYLHRFLCTWFAVFALFWGYEILIYSGLGSALVSALFVWVWLDKAGWEQQKSFYEPIGYALGFSVLTLNVQHIIWRHGLFYRQSDELNWFVLNAVNLSAVLNSLVLLYFVYRISKEHAINFSSMTGKLIILAAVLLLFSAMPVIGLSSAVLVFLVGYARQKLVLMVLGVLSLIGFVSWYYYSMNQTLLFKSIVLMAMGLVLTAGYFLLTKLYATEESNKEIQEDLINHPSNKNAAWQKAAVAATLLIALIGVNHAIYQKEEVLDSGRSVFLQLAPVDPRSIMQGDYMRLRFDIANQIRNSEVFRESRESALNGLAVVDIDERGVGAFNAIYQGQSLSENQVLMQYRQRRGRIQFATNAFFFQEGDAKLFEAAQFGEFKVAADGELLLKAMYDENLKLLGENRLD